MAQSKNSACCGIGVIPEGVECDEILFDIVSEVSVRSVLKPVRDFIAEYIQARYGIVNGELIKAYETLFEKVYTEDIVRYQHESGLLACPSLSADRVCYWAGHSIVDDNAYLANIAESLLKYYDTCKERGGYRKDLVAILRQLIANESWQYVYGLQAAIRKKDLIAFEKNANKFMSLFDLQEKVVDCDNDLNLQKYLDKAAKRGHSEKDKSWLIRTAKLLITFWNESQQALELHDYAAREYGDMLRYFYKPRWKKFIDDVRKALQNGEDVVDYNRYKYDKVFLEREHKYLVKVRNDLFDVAKSTLLNI